MDTARTSELSAVSAGGKTSRKSMQTFAAVGGVLHYVRGETLEVEVCMGRCGWVCVLGSKTVVCQ